MVTDGGDSFDAESAVAASFRQRGPTRSAIAGPRPCWQHRCMCSPASRGRAARAALAGTLLLAAVGGPGCAAVPTGTPDLPDGVRKVDARTLAGRRSWLDGWPARAGGGLVHVVVEIPAGDIDKWEVSKPAGRMRWELRDGEPRRIRYLGYPGNYGMIPRTLLAASAGGDGDPLDVLVLGPAARRGQVIAARPVAVLRLLDRGQQDDKIIAVDPAGPFAAVTDRAALDRFVGVSSIVRTFFASYKGPGKMVVKGWGDAADARALVTQAEKMFEAARSPER